MVKRLAARYVNFLTATPMSNRPVDLHGFLVLWWDAVFSDANLDDLSPPAPVEYSRAFEKLEDDRA